VGVPEEDVVGKQAAAVVSLAVGVPEGDMVGKENGAVRICSRRWPQDCQPRRWQIREW